MKKALHALLFVLTCALTGTVHAGALYNGICYSANSEAQDAFYSSSSPWHMMQSNNQSYMQRFEFVSGVWRSRFYLYNAQNNMVLATDYVVPAFTFPSCNPSQSFLDGVTIGWGVASAFVAAAVIAHMRKAAK